MVGIYEALPISYIRKAALKEALRQVRIEDQNTDYLDIGPVNKPMHMLISWLEDGPDSGEFKKHVSRIPDFMWYFILIRMSVDGMMMNGTNGSQLWDTAFAVQAILEGKLANEPEFIPMIDQCLNFLEDCQIKRNHQYIAEGFRHPTQGAWPFSTRDQGYTVSDCTAEALKSVIMIQNRDSCSISLISDERLFDAVDILLSMQNASGGYASYEAIRGPKWMELLNPAQVFGNIMVEYEYPECTTAVLLGLQKFQYYYPQYRAEEVKETISGAVGYIRSSQLDDGSWYGAWGICFTYATFFAVESLSSIGENYDNSDAIRKACDFLVNHQMSDGGWGETYKSCETQTWNNHETSQIVQTSWALLALMSAKFPNRAVIDRGIQLIMSRQQSNGEWLQEGIEGVFNKVFFFN